jgi:hypothetical protein
MYLTRQIEKSRDCNIFERISAAATSCFVDRIDSLSFLPTVKRVIAIANNRFFFVEQFSVAAATRIALPQLLFGMSSSDEDEKRRAKRRKEDEAFLALRNIAAKVATDNAAFCVLGYNDSSDKEVTASVDHRSLPRSARREFNHERALQCIQEDYLGFPDRPDYEPTFDGAYFQAMFHISKARFLRIRDDFVADPDPFYTYSRRRFCRQPASVEAKILLPLKTFAYGVPPHAFCDYFQMSDTLALDCCKKFTETMKRLYEKEYLRLPTKEDMESIYHLHQIQHSVDGMFGSLDCMHTLWKNCPVAWQGAYKGVKKKPSIVLEAACDFNLWFWHAAFGYCGTTNDKSIFNLSPLLESMLNDTFKNMEELVVPYHIGNEEFKRMFLLVDGIYPKYARFVPGISEPVTEEEKRYTAWQEAARKDIERAFGVLQAKFQVLARPIHVMKLADIHLLVSACLILHNMCVSDRIMKDVNLRYNPCGDPTCVAETVENVPMPSDLREVQERYPVEEEATNIGVHNLPADGMDILIHRNEWDNLRCLDEHKRLINALIDYKNNY